MRLFGVLYPDATLNARLSKTNQITPDMKKILDDSTQLKTDELTLLIDKIRS
jgi:hypothetical protein